MYWSADELKRLEDSARLIKEENWITLFAQIMEAFYSKSHEEYDQMRSIWKGKKSLWIYPFVGFLEEWAEKCLMPYEMQKDGEFTQALEKSFHGVVFHVSSQESPDWKNTVSSKELFLKYPLIARGLTLYTAAAMKSLELAAERIRRDKAVIEEKLFEGRQIVIQSLKLLETDFHGEETGVYEITCDKGKFVYKPRTLGAYEILNDMIALCCKEELKQIAYVDMDNYGYVEYLEDKVVDAACSEEYMTGWGAFLALIMVFNTSDLHVGNILHKDNCPMLVDAETLITPKTKAGDAGDEFGSLMNKGIFASFKAVNNPKFSGEPLGALSLAVKEVLEIGTLSLEQCINSLIKGFVKTAEGIEQNRETCRKMAESGKYDNIRFRFLMRDSQIYHRLLASSYTAERASHKRLFCENLKRLEKSYLQFGQETDHWKIGICEAKEARQGNIPLFYTNFSNRQVYMHGKPVCMDLLERTPKEEFLCGIGQFQKEKIYWWTYSIRKILERLFEEKQDSGKAAALVMHRPSEKEKKSVCTAEQLEERVHLIYKKIIQGRIAASDHGGYWMQKRNSGIYVSDQNYFDGRVGIARFLAAYGKVYSDEEASGTARAILESCGRTWKRSQAKRKNVSLMGGLSGILFVCGQTEEGLETERGGLTEYFLSLLSEGVPFKSLDLYYGLAGVLYAAASVEAGGKGAALTEYYGNLLMYSLWTLEHSSLNDSFAHGKAGIAFALSRAYEKTGREGFIQKAAELLEECQIPKSETVWGMCKGLTGISFAALGIPQKFRTVHIDMLTAAGKKRCMDSYIVNQESLCCGNSGLAMLAHKLYLASQEEEAYRCAVKLWQKNDCRGTDPGFFTGLAGQGYGMLGLLYPKQIKEIW